MGHRWFMVEARPWTRRYTRIVRAWGQAVPAANAKARPGHACVHGVLSAVLYLFYLLKTFSLFVVAGESDLHFRVTGGRCPPQFMHTFCDASNEITMRC